METHLFWGQKVKGQGHESQQVFVGLQAGSNIAAACVHKPRRIFPATMPRRASHASNIRVFPVSLPRGRCCRRETLTLRERQTAGFSVRGVFRSQPAA